MSDVCGKYMFDKFNEIVEDTRRMFMKVTEKEIAGNSDVITFGFSVKLLA